MTKRQELIIVLLLASIQFIHILDFVIMMPLGPSLMESFAIGPREFARLVSSYNFSAATMGLLYAFVADRFDRKLLLMLVMIGFTVGTVFCGVAQSSNQMLFARVATGAFGGVLNSVVFAIVADLIPFERRGRALGIVMSSFSMASVFGVPLGLAINDSFGVAYSFYTIAAVSLLISLGALFILPSLKAHASSKSARVIISDLKTTFFRPKHLLAFAFIMTISMSMFLVIPFLAPYATKNVGISKDLLKYMYLVGGICTVVTARIFGIFTDKFGALKMFLILTSLATIPVLVYTHAPPMHFIYLLLISAVFMILVSGRMIPGMTMITAVPSSEERGSFMALLNSLRAVGSASSTYIAGLIIVENADGSLVHFNRVGYLSVGIIIISLIMAIYVSKAQQAKST
jgi:DHA1 family inner membrane transport protein